MISPVFFECDNFELLLLNFVSSERFRLYSRGVAGRRAPAEGVMEDAAE